MSSLQTGQIRRGADFPLPMIMRATTIVKAAEEDGVIVYDEEGITALCLSCIAKYIEAHWPSDEPRPTTHGQWKALVEIGLTIVNAKIEDDDDGDGLVV